MIRFLAALALAAALAPHAFADAVHHELRIVLDPETRELRAEDRIHIAGSGDRELRLAPSLSLEAVAVDGAPLSPQRGRDGGWRVTLGNAASHLVEVRYRGTLAALAEALSHRDTLVALPPMASMRGSFLPASSGWYPDVDGSSFTYRVSLDLPQGQRGLVPGRLVEEREERGRAVAVFDFPHPAEGIDLMAGPYRVDERRFPLKSGGEARLRTYFHPEIADLAAGYLDAIGGYLDLYGERIGAYPYGEFSVVSSPLPTGFGMPTLTYLGIDVLRLPFIRATSLGHEILHNWWGNGVYVDWRRGNWSEGLTAFMADYAYKEREGADAARAMRLEWLRDFASIPVGQDEPLARFTSRTHGTSQIVGYGKAAFLFFMLRDRIGAPAFDAGLKRFWSEQKFRRAGWADLQRAFEASSGEDLRAFFDQWLNRRGAPAVRIAGAQPSAGGRGVEVTLAQAAPAYGLDAPVIVATEAGREPRTVRLAGETAKIALETGARPLSVVLDPDFRLFRRLDAAEAPPILRQVIVDPGTAVVVASGDSAVIRAARDLATRLLDAPPRFLDAATEPETIAGPLLVVGTISDVDAYLARHRLPPRPEKLARGSAQAWTERRPGGRMLAAISARDAAGLAALARPLPHYGRQSFLVFDGARAVERGVWPARENARTVE